jgi:(heptosyl)LPS beta-1,4-glucosyltransferase
MGIDVQPIFEEYQRMKSYNFRDFVPAPEKLSAIVITKNEEKNIRRCLESLSFADEIIVVDSGSTDKTCEIARSFEKLKLFHTEWFGFVENKKIAIGHAQHEWIFWIDADEVAPESIKEEWEKALLIPAMHEIGGFDLARKTFFLGHWIKHSGWYPNRTVRIFHRDRAYFSQNILHESALIKKGYSVHHFNTNLLHYSYTSLYQYFDKMNKYGISGAKEVIRKKKFVLLPQLFFQPLWTFFRFYFLKKGFLDGRMGLIICMGAAFSNFIKYTNYFFLKKYGSVEEKKDEAEALK